MDLNDIGRPLKYFYHRRGKKDTGRNQFVMLSGGNVAD